MLNHRFCNGLLLAVLSGVSVLAVGCGESGPELGKVSGVVTLNDQPAIGAQVTFVSTKPDGSTSYGVTDASGKYTLKFTRDKWGAMLGDHIVKVETGEKDHSDEKDASADKSGPTKIPRSYGAKSNLKANVTAGSNVINLELTGADNNPINQNRKRLR